MMHEAKPHIRIRARQLGWVVYTYPERKLFPLALLSEAQQLIIARPGMSFGDVVRVLQRFVDSERLARWRG